MHLICLHPDMSGHDMQVRRHGPVLAAARGGLRRGARGQPHAPDPDQGAPLRPTAGAALRAHRAGDTAEGARLATHQLIDAAILDSDKPLYLLKRPAFLAN